MNNSIILTILATTIMFLFTMLGSSMVFFLKNAKQKYLDIFLALSGGIMLSSTIFSLIIPSIKYSNKLKEIPSVNLSIGILFGSLFIFLINKLYERKSNSEDNNLKRKITSIMLSIMVHNIPEGFVVGLAFGSISSHLSSISSAFILSLGIAIQNFPEGSSISIPFSKYGIPVKKSFWFGTISGIVEPIAGLLGCILACRIKIIMPLSLAFGAGSMLYSLIRETIPEFSQNEKKDIMALSFIFGFIIMLILDFI